MTWDLRIIFDYSNLACRSIYSGREFAGTEQEWQEVTPAIFTHIHDFVTDVANIMDEGESVEVILAQDWRGGYWRRDFYPPYKAGRSEQRDASDIDWRRAYQEFDALARRLDETTPWKALLVQKCEADDIIYTMASRSDKPVIIYSGDSDYLQLVNENISLYMPHHQDYAEFPRICKIGSSEIYCKDAHEYLESLLSG